MLKVEHPLQMSFELIPTVRSATPIMSISKNLPAEIATPLLHPSSQCENLVLQAPLKLEELVDGQVALPVLAEEEGDQAGVDALANDQTSTYLS